MTTGQARRYLALRAENEELRSIIRAMLRKHGAREKRGRITCLYCGEPLAPTRHKDDCPVERFFMIVGHPYAVTLIDDL